MQIQPFFFQLFQESILRDLEDEDDAEVGDILNDDEIDTILDLDEDDSR